MLVLLSLITALTLTPAGGPGDDFHWHGTIAKGRTLVVIDHDMDALFELAGRITVLQEGKLLVEGTPDEIKGNAQVQEAYLKGMHEVTA